MGRAIWVKVGGNWNKVKNVWVNINGVWKQNVVPKLNVSGNWKDCISYYNGMVYVAVSTINGLVINEINAVTGDVIRSFPLNSLSPSGNFFNGKITIDNDKNIMYLGYTKFLKINLNNGSIISTINANSGDNYAITKNNYLITMNTPKYIRRYTPDNTLDYDLTSLNIYITDASVTSNNRVIFGDKNSYSVVVSEQEKYSYMPGGGKYITVDRNGNIYTATDSTLKKFDNDYNLIQELNWNLHEVLGVTCDKNNLYVIVRPSAEISDYYIYRYNLSDLSFSTRTTWLTKDQIPKKIFVDERFVFGVRNVLINNNNKTIISIYGKGLNLIWEKTFDAPISGNSSFIFGISKPHIGQYPEKWR